MCDSTETQISTPDQLERDHAEYEAKCVDAFIASIKPLSGCCFCGDEHFNVGRAAVTKVAMAHRYLDDDMLPSIKECVSLLEYLTCVEPISPEHSYASGGEETVGFNRVLDAVQQRLKEHLGIAEETEQPTDS